MSQSTPQPERSCHGRPPARRQDAHPGRPVPDPVDITTAPDTVRQPPPATDQSTSSARLTVRASDAEREAAVERLRIASVRRGELEHITADLPGLGAPGANPAPVQVKRKFSAVMGDCKERIVGRIDGPLEAVSVMGDVELDLRGAQVTTGEVLISATAIMGDVKIIVPDGVSVELSGHNFLGDRKVNVRDPHPGARVPVVRVTATAVMGDIKIVDDEHHAPVRRAITEWWKDRK